MYYHRLATFCDSTRLGGLSISDYHIPQVRANNIRQSTVGWSSGQVVFQITGGVLPIMHLVVESSL